MIGVGSHKKSEKYGSIFPEGLVKTDFDQVEQGESKKMFCLVFLVPLALAVAFYEVNIPVITAFRAIWKPEKSEKKVCSLK